MARQQTPAEKYQQRQKAKLRPKDILYTAGMEWDFTWLPSEIEDFIYLWNEGTSLPDMALYFGRKQEEVAILVMDLAEQKRIGKRPGGVFGG